MIKSFNTKTDIIEAVRHFLNVMQSDLVMIKKREVKIEEYKETLQLRFSFEATFDLRDKYINFEPYLKGSAYIYLSKKFYSDADRYGEQIFGKNPMWNNTGTIGWF